MTSEPTTAPASGAAAPAGPGPDAPAGADGRTTLPPGVELGFEQTVPRSLAHRRQIGEVFVADSAQLGEDDHYLSFQIPRAHSLWSDQRAAYHDPLASAEAARQSLFVLLHRHVGIPVGLPFSLQRIALRVRDTEAYVNDRTSALQGHVHYRITDRTGRGSDVVSMSLRATVVIGGRRAMSVDTEVAFMSQDDYDVLRSFRRAQKPVDSARATPARRLPPAEIGRENPRNVVIGVPAAGPPEPGTAAGRTVTGDPRDAHHLLAADPTHPAFYDHEYDHVPGPLMVEGMRQAAVAAARRAGLMPSPHALTVGCEAAFLDFAEPEADLNYESRVDGPDPAGRVPVRIGLRQFGQYVVEGRVELLPDPTTKRTETQHGE